jgi:ATP-dependent helicase/nuclease subunit A
MTKEWTREQADAISGRDRRLLVAAAAGAGKTAVLVERIIRRITDPAGPVDVDRLLVVTFTAAAAAEMRERIGLAITRALEVDPGSGLLRRQLALLQRANISTIHSFCLEIVRQHFYRLELDPVFRVADETEAALLQLDVLEDVFERRFAAGDQHFLALADCYGGRRDDTGLQDLVLELFRFSRSTPDPAGWLQKLPVMFDLTGEEAIDDLPWFRILKTGVSRELSGVRGLLEQAARLAGQPGGPLPYLSTLKRDLALLDDLTRACAGGWDKLYRQFVNTGFARLATCKKGEADEELKKMAKKMRDGAKERIIKMQQRYFSRSPAELLDDLHALAPLMGVLAGLVTEFASCYRQAKLDRGMVDFSDLEHYALQVLLDVEDAAGSAARPSPVALELRNRFAEILVDEYQDINAVQEAIINLVAGPEDEAGPGLFMVGDVKQSIYRFRLAEPGLFMAKYQGFAAGTGAGRLINLARNFRSRRPVVDAVNYIFRQVMSPDVGEMAYDEKAELVCGARYPDLPGDAWAAGTTELHLIETGEGPGAPADETAGTGEEADAASEAEEDLDAVQVEARTVAQRISKLLEDGYPVFDRERGQYRPATYRDVVVLLRATTGRANIYVEEFARFGVPAYADLNTGYFEAVEVETVLSLLKIIDNPRQDVPLAAVLRSPVAGFDSDELAQIRLSAGRGDFYDAVVMAALEGPEKLAGRLARFLQRLEQWRTRARQGGLAELIWLLYRETGYYDFVGGLPGGGQRQANLRALYHRARQYESTAYRGLFRFLRFIERIRENDGDMGAARALGENENLVRIMSIHKSKGLEFPIVIVAGLGKRFNLMDLNKSVLMHRDLGLGPQLVDPEKRVTFPTVAKLAVREKLRAEALAEEMRVLYVAMTRAREKLILVGTVRKLRECAARWCSAVEIRERELPAWLTAGAAHYLDWLGPALARHRDGAPLRELAGAGEPPAAAAGDASAWRVYLWDGAARQREKEDRPAFKYMEYVRRREPVPAGGPQAGRVRECLTWRYPHRHLQGLAARETVTGLKKPASPDGGPGPAELTRDFRISMAARPAFAQKLHGLTAAERGQALHLALQLLDLRGRLDEDGIRDQLAAMVLREQISREHAAAVDPQAVAAFFRSPLGQRLLRSKRVYRELPFTLAVPAEQVYPHVEIPAGSGETVLVQGIIDCLAEEGDGLLLVDYKTDRYAPDTLTQTAGRYRDQLELYARAAQNITGRRVIAAYLYMFYGGDTVSL